MYSRHDEESRPISLDLVMTPNGEYREFGLGIDFYNDLNNDLNEVKIISMKFPKKYFEGFETISWNNYEVRAPFSYRNYLRYLYGDWRTPKSDISFTDYPNTIGFDYAKYQQHTVREIR